MENHFNELYKAAADLIKSRHKSMMHTVAAAVMGASGKIYASVNLDCYLRRAAVCAEPGAISAALSAGESYITGIVAVRYDAAKEEAPWVVSPCGICRELIADYGPDADVFVPDENGCEHAVTIHELLPNRYAKLSKRG